MEIWLVPRSSCNSNHVNKNTISLITSKFRGRRIVVKLLTSGYIIISEKHGRTKYHEEIVYLPMLTKMKPKQKENYAWDIAEEFHPDCRYWIANNLINLNG